MERVAGRPMDNVLPSIRWGDFVEDDTLSLRGTVNLLVLRSNDLQTASSRMTRAACLR